MMSISLAAAVTAMWLVSLPEDHQLHLPRMDPTRAMAAEAQPTQERFEQERNAEIDASIAAVAARRVQERFERERNAEIDASIAAVAARRVQERFERERNAEIDASIAAVAARRVQERFEQERNAEIDASIAAVAARRVQERFEQERNAEIDASIAAVAARRVQERFEQERNAEIDASIAAVAARRVQERFEQERNAEIDASIATNLTPWVVSIANLQGGSFAAGDGPAVAALVRCAYRQHAHERQVARTAAAGCRRPRVTRRPPRKHVSCRLLHTKDCRIFCLDLIALRFHCLRVLLHGLDLGEPLAAFALCHQRVC